MQLIWYEPDDTAHTLLDSATGMGFEGAELTLLREQGTGAPSLRDKTESGPNQHGATLLLQRLRPRQIKLQFELHSPDKAAGIVKARRAFAKWFKANSKVTHAYGRLRWVTDVTREIKARAIGGLAFDWKHDETDYMTLDLVLMCDDPLWYDPTIRMETWSQTALNSLAWPLYFPVRFAATDEIYSTYEVTNAGDWEAYPTIVVTGPATDLIIDNRTTGERLSLPGVTITEGEQATFDLTPGAKRVYAGAERNLFPYLNQPTELATWHLAAAPEATGGANTIFVNARETTADTAIVMSWYNQYWSS
jgi:hypothetical protein